MDSIDISGKKYISSKQAASLTGYAQDYVGQLARSGKVPGTRVGRAWYIEKDAILSHAGVVADTPTVTPPEEPQEVSSDRSRQKNTVLPVSVPGTTTKSLHSLQQGVKSNFKTWGSIQYLDDAADLMPKVTGDVHKESLVKINRITSENIDNSAPITFKKSIPDRTKVTSVVSPEPLTRQKTQAVSLLPLGLVAATLTLMLVTSAASGVYLPDTWTYAGGSQVASLGGDYGPILSILVTFFQEGVTLLVTFVSFFINSLQTFFNLGLDFLEGIFNNLGHPSFFF